MDSEADGADESFDSGVSSGPGDRGITSSDAAAGNPGDAEALSSSFFATVRTTERPSKEIPGDGDLWPSCWSNDGFLYAAWGDGKGFGNAPFTDIGVARISGTPSDNLLKGENIAVGDAVGQVWTATTPGAYTRKPTGIACVDGDIYLAVQDLAKNFDDAPVATIARSKDKGRTWEWNRSQPMFRNHELTTLFFLDSGQDGARTDIDGYVYVYALDGNWRDSFTDRVKDPTRLWLARAPRKSIQDRQSWQWFAGLGDAGTPRWTSVTADRVAVLTDDRRVYSKVTSEFGPDTRDMTVLSQGSVVYNAPLQRYLYTSWTEYTWEFYEAPAPWGPFKLFFTKDFGGYPWSQEKMGGYATGIPSKFIAADGRTMFVQSNTWVGGANSYTFSLRPLSVEPFAPSTPMNAVGDPIPTTTDGAVAIGSSFRSGHPEFLSNGIVIGQSEESRTGGARLYDYWGYEWPREYNMNRLSYTSGAMSSCGWFEDLAVEARQKGSWHQVEGLTATPAYSSTKRDAYRTYVLRFKAMSADGIRLRGKPGGAGACTSIAELSVGYD